MKTILKNTVLEILASAVVAAVITQILSMVVDYWDWYICIYLFTTVFFCYAPLRGMQARPATAFWLKAVRGICFVIGLFLAVTGISIILAGLIL